MDKNNNDNLKELSLILPEFLRYSVDDVIKLYNQVFDMLEANVQDTQKRVISNIAYAYTGALMLIGISGVKFENIQEKVIEYAKQQITKYENIKTPVEKVLSAIVILHQLGQLENGTHFKVKKVNNEGKEELHIRFHKGVVLGQINKYYAHDKLKRINEDSFLDYARNHKRYRAGNHGVRYDDDREKVVGSICFDITGLEEFRDFGSIIEPMSADELRAKVQERNNT